ncbi:hypothetical protein [Rhodococcus triatomae]
MTIATFSRPPANAAAARGSSWFSTNRIKPRWYAGSPPRWARTPAASPPTSRS